MSMKYKLKMYEVGKAEPFILCLKYVTFPHET